MSAFNVINGGPRAGNKLAMQKFFILPTGASTFKEAMRIGDLTVTNPDHFSKALDEKARNCLLSI